MFLHIKNVNFVYLVKPLQLSDAAASIFIFAQIFVI